MTERDSLSYSSFNRHYGTVSTPSPRTRRLSGSAEREQGDIERSNSYSSLDDFGDRASSVIFEKRLKIYLSIVCIFLVFLFIYGISVRKEIFSPEKTVQNESNDDSIFVVYIIRHAEMKNVTQYKCDPPMKPFLPDSIGYCDNFGNNVCGGDYLTNAGLSRADCIAKQHEKLFIDPMLLSSYKHRNIRRSNSSGKLPLMHIDMILTQEPGRCGDLTVKREYQTVLPLSRVVNITINTSVHKYEDFYTAETIKSLNSLCKPVRSNGVQSSVSKLGSTAGNKGSILQRKRVPVVVVSWDHMHVPNLLVYLGCHQSFCGHPVNMYDFDRYYKLELSCRDSKLLNVDILYENCSSSVIGYRGTPPT